VLNYNIHVKDTNMQLRTSSGKIDSLGDKLENIRDRCMDKIDSGVLLQTNWNCKTEDRIHSMN